MEQEQKTYLDLTGLEALVTLLGKELAKSFKSAKFDKSTKELSFFRSEDQTGTADFSVTIPETDISNLIEKLSTTNVGNVVITKADGTVEDGGVALADLSTKVEVKVVSDKVDTNETAIKKNAEAISLLNDDSSVEGSVDYKIAQAVAAIMENPDETMNSINELVTWCNEHAEEALTLSNNVSKNTSSIETLEKLVGTSDVEQQITDAIADALTINGVDKYALATDLTAAIARIVELESKAHEHDNKEVLDGITANKVSAWDDAEENAKKYADALAINYDSSGSANAAETNAKKYADDLNTQMDERVSELENLVGEGMRAITVTEINALFE